MGGKRLLFGVFFLVSALVAGTVRGDAQIKEAFDSIY